MMLFMAVKFSQNVVQVVFIQHICSCCYLVTWWFDAALDRYTWFFFLILMMLEHVTQCCRICAWVAQMVCAIWDCTLLMNHAWSSWYLHSWGPYKGWNSQYPVMVHCRRGYILHRFYNSVCGGDHSLCMGRGREMGLYPTVWDYIPPTQWNWTSVLHHECFQEKGLRRTNQAKIRNQGSVG